MGGLFLARLVIMESSRSLFVWVIFSNDFSRLFRRPSMLSEEKILRKVEVAMARQSEGSGRLRFEIWLGKVRV